MTEPDSPHTLEFDRQYATAQIRRSRHPLRRFFKGFYLRQLLQDVNGRCIDFGCGAGQLLAKLPAGSVGLEVNPYLIEWLHTSGLIVRTAHANMQDFELEGLTSGSFQTLVIAHVLEHLPDPAAALATLLASCARLGVKRVIIVVPGAKGYASDRTHKTFINSEWLENRTPLKQSGFIRRPCSYFPGPWKWIGRYFVFHETKIIFDRTDV